MREQFTLQQRASVLVSQPEVTRSWSNKLVLPGGVISPAPSFPACPTLAHFLATTPSIWFLPVVFPVGLFQFS